MDRTGHRAEGAARPWSDGPDPPRRLQSRPKEPTSRGHPPGDRAACSRNAGGAARCARGIGHGGGYTRAAIRVAVVPGGSPGR
ncbi:MAG: hypothetical protein AVDCRST_MAG49-212 [uncultured Thermomicrobiales bacterium]|uniref:Uncharacterized protein n=1 Tax=uncultured Thermomicrobiales bacterium TaxID=1645740 RepID=A0A6J4TZC7_9BACT|nr:MAG: hypothetical protein AVDCRST_MAG49-212 [uncultured Thermomicrobiales bacterium]